jgi:hypothetical protein
VKAGRQAHEVGDHDLQTIVPSIHFLSHAFAKPVTSRQDFVSVCEMMRLNSQTDIISQKSARIKRAKLELSNT